MDGVDKSRHLRCCATHDEDYAGSAIGSSCTLLRKLSRTVVRGFPYRSATRPIPEARRWPCRSSASPRGAHRPASGGRTSSIAAPHQHAAPQYVLLWRAPFRHDLLRPGSIGNIVRNSMTLTALHQHGARKTRCNPFAKSRIFQSNSQFAFDLVILAAFAFCKPGRADSPPPESLLVGGGRRPGSTYQIRNEVSILLGS